MRETKRKGARSIKEISQRTLRALAKRERLEADKVYHKKALRTIEK